MQIDAPMEDKTGTTLGAGVTGPGEAETVRGVPLGMRTAINGQHNWVPIGLATSVAACGRSPWSPATAASCTRRRPPAASTRASTAPSRGSRCGTTSRRSRWRGLSICRDHPEVIWAATGESRQGRSGNVALPNAGVLRSVDRGVHWTQPNDLEPIRSVRLHAVAAHPTLRRRLLGRRTRGVYRTTDGGTTWTHFADDTRLLGRGLRAFRRHAPPLPRTQRLGARGRSAGAGGEPARGRRADRQPGRHGSRTSPRSCLQGRHPPGSAPIRCSPMPASRRHRGPGPGIPRTASSRSSRTPAAAAPTPSSTSPSPTRRRTSTASTAPATRTPARRRG